MSLDKVIEHLRALAEEYDDQNEYESSGAIRSAIADFEAGVHLKKSKADFLINRVLEQRQWVESHRRANGGTLQGYIDRYGDPGVPPKDEEGLPRLVKMPESLAARFEYKLSGLSSDGPLYYQKMHGNGGTAIFKADTDALKQYEVELTEHLTKSGQLDLLRMVIPHHPKGGYHV